MQAKPIAKKGIEIHLQSPLANNGIKPKTKKYCPKIIPVSNALRKVGIDLRGVLFKSIHQAFGGNLREIVCGGAPIRPEIGKFFNGFLIFIIGYNKIINNS